MFCYNVLTNAAAIIFLRKPLKHNNVTFYATGFQTFWGMYHFLSTQSLSYHQSLYPEKLCAKKFPPILDFQIAKHRFLHMFEIWGFHRNEFGFWRCVDLSVDANVSEKHTISVFRAEDGDSVFLQNFGINRRVCTFVLISGSWYILLVLVYQGLLKCVIYFLFPDFICLIFLHFICYIHTCTWVDNFSTICQLPLHKIPLQNKKKILCRSCQAVISVATSCFLLLSTNKNSVFTITSNANSQFLRIPSESV
jgi:hypothetical protein